MANDYDINTLRNAKPLLTTDGGYAYLRVAASGNASPPNVVVTRVHGVLNTGAAQTGTLSLYDAVDKANPQASELVWSATLPSAPAPVWLHIPIQNNFVAVMSGTPSSGSTLLILYT